MHPILLPSIALFLGLLIGAIIKHGISYLYRTRTQNLISDMISKAEAEAETIIAQSKEDARHYNIQLKNSYADEYSQTQQNQAEEDAELDQRLHAIEVHEREIHDIEEIIKSRENKLENSRNKNRQIKSEIQTLQDKELDVISKQAQITRNDAISQLKHDLISRSQHEMQQWSHLYETESKQHATKTARQIIDTACDRYAVVEEPDRWNNTVQLTNPKMIECFKDDQNTFVKELSGLINSELFFDDETESVLIKAEAPLEREKGRRVLRYLVENNILTIEPLKKLIQDIDQQLSKEVHSTGRKAVNYLKLKSIPDDLITSLGHLKYRLSYSQNQWHHALESAVLAGIIAAELQVDVKITQRATLFHDIGKTLTHEQEGSHAVLGAHVLREHGESPEVINAVASHHGDVTPQSPIAYIVAISDALSGGRPGARREMVTAFLSRIEELSRIVNTHNKVKRIDIMHAGREIRVFVGEQERSIEDENETHTTDIPLDTQLQPLARDIADSIENEMEFPGQIKVNVIKESRVVAYAK